MRLSKQTRSLFGGSLVGLALAVAALNAAPLSSAEGCAANLDALSASPSPASSPSVNCAGAESASVGSFQTAAEEAPLFAQLKSETFAESVGVLPSLTSAWSPHSRGSRNVPPSRAPWRPYTRVLRKLKAFPDGSLSVSAVARLIRASEAVESGEVPGDNSFSVKSVRSLLPRLGIDVVRETFGSSNSKSPASAASGSASSEFVAPAGAVRLVQLFGSEGGLSRLAATVILQFEEANAEFERELTRQAAKEKASLRSLLSARRVSPSQVEDAVERLEAEEKAQRPEALREFQQALLAEVVEEFFVQIQPLAVEGIRRLLLLEGASHKLLQRLLKGRAAFGDSVGDLRTSRLEGPSLHAEAWKLMKPLQKRQASLMAQILDEEAAFSQEAPGTTAGISQSGMERILSKLQRHAESFALFLGADSNEDGALSPSEFALALLLQQLATFSGRSGPAAASASSASRLRLDASSSPENLFTSDISAAFLNAEPIAPRTLPVAAEFLFGIADQNADKVLSAEELSAFLEAQDVLTSAVLQMLGASSAMA